MRRTVIFIETEGKAATLRRSLNEVGLDADLMIVGSSIYSMPEILPPIGIDEGFRETHLSPTDQSTLSRIKRCAGMYHYYLVATDPDEEGDLIAADIASILSDENILRLRMSGLDPDSLQTGLNSHVMSFDSRISWPGTARRIVSRVLRGTLTDSESGIASDAPQAAILGMLSTENIQFGQLVLSLKAEDGGDSFDAIIPTKCDNTSEVEELMEKAGTLEQFTVSVAESNPYREIPWSYGQCVAECSVRLNTSIQDVALAIMRLYEAGALSYIWTDSRNVSESAFVRLKAIINAHDHQLQLVKSNIADKSVDFTLEVPRPLVMVDVSTPLKLMVFDDAVLSIITRHLLKCEMSLFKEKPDLRDLPEWAKGLDWFRIKSPSLPWLELKQPEILSTFRLDAALLRAVDSKGICRPKSIIHDVTQFIEKDLCDESFLLTRKGMQWLNLTPPEARRAETLHKINLAVTEQGSHPSDRAAFAIGLLGESLERRALEMINTRMKAYA